MSSERITLNGNEYDPETVSKGLQVLSTNDARGVTPSMSSGIGGADVSSDGSITRWNGQQYDGNRDVYDVLGYTDLDDNTALEKYRSKYERQDIAERIIDIFPQETWKNPPSVVDGEGEESAFEEAANRLIEGDLNSHLRRTDRAQRLGEYGVMLVGFEDGQPLEEPVQAGALDGPEDISHFEVFPQDQVESWQLGKDLENAEESDPSHERYNKPVLYTLDFGDIDAESTDDDFKHVHWTRVVPHAAEGALETDLKGMPALKPVFNRLMDREKVIGASAEMFYTGADRKIIANVQEEFALPQYSDTGERENFKEDLSRLINDLQQTMVGTGMEFEVLGGQEVDPSGVVEQIDASIAANTGIPKNKLQGNETGERSTTMDRDNWFDTISSRQTNFAGPKMLRPVLDRFIEFGILPDPADGNYAIKWPDLDEASESDIAETRNQRAGMLQASGLAMTLSTEQKLTFLEEGPDAVDMEDDVVEVPANESQEQRDAFAEFNDITNARYGEGDQVSTPDGAGVVVDVLTETVEGEDQTVEASSDSPTYAVAVEDESVGIGFYKASDLNAEEIDAEVPAPPSEGENTENAIANALGFVRNDFSPPRSWRQSEQPARLIALKALAGMGGSFDGCVREMRGNVRTPNQFCGSFLDYALGNPYWRGDSPLPGD